MTMDFELIEKYTIFVSLCDTLQVMDLVMKDHRYKKIKTKMVTSPKMLGSSLKKMKSLKNSRSGSMHGKKNRPTAVSMAFPQSQASLETLATHDDQIKIQQVGFKLSGTSSGDPTNLRSPRFSSQSRRIDSLLQPSQSTNQEAALPQIASLDEDIDALSLNSINSMNQL